MVSCPMQFVDSYCGAGSRAADEGARPPPGVRQTVVSSMVRQTVVSNYAGQDPSRFTAEAAATDAMLQR